MDCRRIATIHAMTAGASEAQLDAICDELERIAARAAIPALASVEAAPHRFEGGRGLVVGDAF